MTSVAVKCVGIKKSFGDKENRIEALKGIDLEIYQGQLTLLVGPSGSGKSTLLSIITNILTPDAGEIFLLGQEINRMSPHEKARFCRHHLGVVFQSLFLIPTLTNAENVALPLLLDGCHQHQAQEKAISLLNQMNLGSRAHLPPTQLSKGQQQRVAIARAMVNESKIIVCDEPTSALDQAAGLEVMSFLHELAHDASKAVLVVTHDHRIFPFADRIININDGQIVSGEHYA
jgi:putative ABC transport system ATP-binding protein